MADSTIVQERERRASVLQRARKKKGLSQEGLARAAGFSLSYIQKIENAAKGNAAIVAELLTVIRQHKKSA